MMKNTIVPAPFHILLVVIECLLLGCQEQQGSKTPPTPNPSFINVGISMNDVPGFAVAKGGDRFGFDIDLANYITPKLGHKPVFTPITADNRGPSLKQGAVQMVVSTYSITDNRRKDGIIFAGPYMRTFQGVIVREDDDTVNSSNDLKGKTVCTIKGTTSIENLRKIEKVLVREEETFDLCILAVKNKDVDAASSDAILLQTYAYNDLSLKFLPHVRVPAPYELYGIGFRKDNMQQCQEAAKFLQEFVVNTNWISAYNAYLQPLGIAFQTDPGISPLRPDPEKITSQSCETLD